MKWPNHADYAEAVQNPELCFEAPELHTGVVTTTPLGLPRALSGNFATVYEMTGGGESFAVRCFVRQVTNQQDRYAALERHLNGHQLACLVPFEFIPRGIRVHERWFPIVKMNWVAGVPLHTYVEQHLPSPEKLAFLAADWREMMAGLKRLRIGHGDLQHGNVLVTAEGELKLVDYDGMYVPLFARERSPELGHPNYQHPLRAAEFYDERLDHFPELLVYLSLRALAAEPGLWGEYFNGDNLIATAVDLRVPQCSNLWPRLLRSPDQDVRRLTVVLVECLCHLPIDVPDLETVLNERLSKVVVPDRLEFEVPALLPRVTGAYPESTSEAETEIDAFVRRLDGPLAAMNIERTSVGSRPARETPRLVEVFGWSAVVTALISLVPPMRTVAGLTAVGLGLLAWLMPGRYWQRARVAAALAVVVSVVWLLIGRDVRVAARLQEPVLSAPPKTVELPESEAVDVTTPPAGPVVVPDKAGEPAKGEIPTAAIQPVSRPLHDPVKQPLAAVQQRWKLHGGPVSAVMVSSDQRHVVSAATDRTMAMWSLAQGQVAFARTNLDEPLIALTALTNIGIVASVDAMHRLQWWSLDGALPLKTLPLDPDSLVRPQISSDGEVIASGGGDRRQVRLRFHSAPAGNQTLAGLSSWARLVRFSPDNRRLALACLDDTVSLRRVDSGAVLRTLSFPDATIAELEFSSDGGRLLALGEQGQLRVWHAHTGAVVGDLKLDLNHPLVAWLNSDRDARVIGAADRRLIMVSTLPAVAIEEELTSSASVTAIVGLPDGTGFVTGHQNGELALWRFRPAVAEAPMKLARP